MSPFLLDNLHFLDDLSNYEKSEKYYQDRNSNGNVDVNLHSIENSAKKNSSSSIEIDLNENVNLLNESESSELNSFCTLDYTENLNNPNVPYHPIYTIDLKVSKQEEGLNLTNDNEKSISNNELNENIESTSNSNKMETKLLNLKFWDKIEQDTQLNKFEVEIHHGQTEEKLNETQRIQSNGTDEGQTSDESTMSHSEKNKILGKYENYSKSEGSPSNEQKNFDLKILNFLKEYKHEMEVCFDENKHIIFSILNKQIKDHFDKVKHFLSEKLNINTQIIELKEDLICQFNQLLEKNIKIICDQNQSNICNWKLELDRKHEQLLDMVKILALNKTKHGNSLNQDTSSIIISPNSQQATCNEHCKQQSEQLNKLIEILNEIQILLKTKNDDQCNCQELILPCLNDLLKILKYCTENNAILNELNQKIDHLSLTTINSREENLKNKINCKPDSDMMTTINSKLDLINELLNELEKRVNSFTRSDVHSNKQENYQSVVALRASSTKMNENCVTIHGYSKSLETNSIYQDNICNLCKQTENLRENFASFRNEFKRAKQNLYSSFLLKNYKNQLNNRSYIEKPNYIFHKSQSEINLN